MLLMTHVKAGRQCVRGCRDEKPTTLIKTTVGLFLLGSHLMLCLGGRAGTTGVSLSEVLLTNVDRSSLTEKSLYKR
jgi:hypothetical protein